MDLVRGFARCLYVPDDGTRYSLAVVASIENALREAGLAKGPDGEGVTWKPFRPDGDLANFSMKLGLVFPTIEVDWFDDAHEFVDSFLSPRGPWSRCPVCARLVPSHGHILTPDDEVVSLTECISCGADFDPCTWEPASTRTLFVSRLVVCLAADSSSANRPTFRQACPPLIRAVEAVVGTQVREMLVRG